MFWTNSNSRPPRQNNRAKLNVEGLEDRTVPTAVVTATASLPYAIEGSTGGQFRLSRTDTTGSLTVNYTVGGTATSGTDYYSIGTSAVFSPGVATADIYLGAIADGVYDPGETVVLTLASGTGYTVGTPDAAQMAIIDTTPEVSVDWVYNAQEGGMGGNVQFRRIGDTSAAVTVNLGIGGNATAGSDYTSFGTSVTFAAYSSSAYLYIPVTDDSLSEPTETIVLTLQSGTGYTIGTANTAIVSIFDNDAQYVSVAKLTDAVENGATGTVQFSRIGDLSSSLTVNYSVGGTATSVTDYTALSGTVTFAANAATANVTVTALADNVVDVDETVTATVTTGTGYSVGNPSVASVTIADDPAVVTVANLSDGVEGVSNGSFRFTRTGGDLTSALTATYFAGGTTTVDVDYTALSGSVTFAANATTADVTVTVLDDSTTEFDEELTVYLEDGTGYVVGEGSQATVIIADTETPLVRIESGSDTAEGTSGIFWFTRLGDLRSALTFTIAVSGTATSGTDFTALGTSVTFAAGESSAAVSVDALTDSTIEVDETVIVTIQTGTGYQRDLVYDATLVIVDATQTVTVYGLADAVEGGDSGTFTFVREGNLSQPLTVNFTVSGTATDGTDYDTLPTTVEFAADENTVDITIIPVDDMVTESTEEVELTLASGGYLLGSATSATINLFDKPVAAPPAAGTGNGLLANYYNTKTLDDVRTTKTDPQVNFRDATAWGRGAPTGTTGVGADQFSVRWTGQVKPLYSEFYTFQTFSDDGVRLWVDGVLLIDQWNDHSPTLHNTPILIAPNLTAGQQYDIKLEYYENKLDSTISLSWASTSQKREIIPQSQLFSHAAKAGDLVWLDTNRDGKQDAGEPGIRDVVVDVLDSNNIKVVASTKTGPDGKYEVTVPAGAQIKLKFTPGASSLIPTQQDSVAAGEYLDSDINADGETALFNAAGPGAAPDYYDAGFKGTATNPNSTNSGVLIELDVNNNGVLTDAVDGIANYLPGYEGTTAKLTTLAAQDMKVIVQGLAANTVYKISTVDTSKYAGIASNKEAVFFFANYFSSSAYNDFVLMKADGTSEESDSTDVNVTSDAQGVAIIGVRARDFGGQTTIRVKSATGTLLAERKLVLDSDSDGIADKWEYEMVDRWTNQYGRAGFSLAAALNRFGPNQDDELADPDDKRTDRLVTQAETGDAHTVWEEYRGYFLSGGGLDGKGQNGHAGGHIRLDPARKEILLEVDRAATLNNVPGTGTLDQKLKVILDGTSKVFSNADRGAGIYMYYSFDEITLDLPLNEMNTEDNLMKALKNSRDTELARDASASDLATDFIHLMFADSINSLGGGALTVDRADELAKRGSIIGVTDLMNNQVAWSLDANKFSELLMCAAAHEITHLLIERETGPFDRFEHTKDPNGNGVIVGDTEDKTCLMYQGLPTRGRTEVATVKFFAVVQAEIMVKSNQALVLG